MNARSQTDQQRFVNDLQESVAETTEMEKAKMFLNSRCASPDTASLHSRTVSPAFSPAQSLAGSTSTHAQSFPGSSAQDLENRRNEAQILSERQRQRELEILQFQQSRHQMAPYMSLEAAETMC